MIFLLSSLSLLALGAGLTNALSLHDLPEIPEVLSKTIQIYLYDKLTIHFRMEIYGFFL